MWFLPPLLDVCGTETDWVADKQWQPPTADELYYRRSASAAKPYCFLMNTNFDCFTHEMVEKYMKWCGFFGMFPSFFSANAASGHYFCTPQLYERDRPLFKKYMPIIKCVAESGWECITNASCDHPEIFVERFGENYITVLNHSLKDDEFTVSFDLPCDEVITDEITGSPYTVKDGKCDFRLAGHDVLILRLHR